MGINTKATDEEQVTAHISKLDDSQREMVGYLRKIILKTDKKIGEQIKWNSPSFYYTGEMKPFDPKEYKRDIVVTNLHRGRIMLVFPTGTKVKDTTGLLEGDYKDGRRIMNFTDLDDVKSKEKGLQKIIKEWIKMVDK